MQVEDLFIGAWVLTDRTHVRVISLEDPEIAPTEYPINLEAHNGWRTGYCSMETVHGIPITNKILRTWYGGKKLPEDTFRISQGGQAVSVVRSGSLWCVEGPGGPGTGMVVCEFVHEFQLACIMISGMCVKRIDLE